MKTYWVPCACVIALLSFGCRGDGTNEELSQETETGDGDTGDGDGDTGDGDGDTGDGDGDTGDGDGDTGDGDGDGDGDSGDGDGDGDTGDGDGDTGDGDGDGDGDEGDGDGEPGDGDGEPGDGDGDTGDGDGDGETGNLTCDEIELEYNMLVETNVSCSQPSDCQVLDGHCFMGLGGCWYVTNKDVSQSDLDNLANQFQGQGCFGPICLCIPPPGSVSCVEGTCQPS